MPINHSSPSIDTCAPPAGYTHVLFTAVKSILKGFEGLRHAVNLRLDTCDRLLAETREYFESIKEKMVFLIMLVGACKAAHKLRSESDDYRDHDPNVNDLEWFISKYATDNRQAGLERDEEIAANSSEIRRLNREVAELREAFLGRVTANDNQ